MRAMARAKDDPVTERFMEYFYAKCCENLFRPMVELPEYQKITGAIAFFPLSFVSETLSETWQSLFYGCPASGPTFSYTYAIF